MKRERRGEELFIFTFKAIISLWTGKGKNGRGGCSKYDILFNPSLSYECTDFVFYTLRAVHRCRGKGVA
jgi:hypothetical protein